MNKTVIMRKLGGSLCFIIPRPVTRELELVEGSELRMVVTNGVITLRKPGGSRAKPAAQVKDSVVRRNGSAQRKPARPGR